MAELVFFSGTMDCGKSTLALQTDHNHAARGRAGVVFTSRDRAGGGMLSSRLGLTVPAVEVADDLDFRAFVVARLSSGVRVDYLICDEAQFYTPAQVEQLAVVVDEFDIDVFAFGISTDFRTRLFPGSARFMELADRVQVLQVAALCWCGARATHNARTVDGEMVVEGDQVVVGDVGATVGADGGSADPVVPADTPAAGGGDVPGPVPAGPVIAYEVLCRRHHRARLTAHAAEREHMSPQPLPFA